jgi:hypothetical protein
MTEEQKKLLTSYLDYSRSYGLILECCGTVGEVLKSINELPDGRIVINDDWDLDEVKPCLIKFEDLSFELRKEFIKLVKDVNQTIRQSVINSMKFYLTHHVDIFGLIDQGLANDITKTINPYKK